MIMNPTAIKHVVVDGHSLTLESFVAIARYNATVELAPSALEAMQKSRALAEKIAAEGRVAYGITTGFGEFQKVAVPKEMSNQLSTNLILSHCTAAGEPYADEIVRGMMLLRANALCGGVSGVRPILVEMLLEMLNKGVTPVVPQKGSLGSSGDLAPLAHMTLPMLGKGEAMYEGVKMPGAEAMAKAGIKTLDTLVSKEGLGMTNGTCAMTSVGALALYDTICAAQLGDVIASMSFEGLTGLRNAFDPRIHQVRGQKGQMLVAANMRKLLDGSEILDNCQKDRVQDAYALRCIPQLHGACRDALDYVREKVEIELNAVTDNPLMFLDDEAVISGGNFHGEPMAVRLPRHRRERAGRRFRAPHRAYGQPGSVQRPDRVPDHQGRRQLRLHDRSVRCRFHGQREQDLRSPRFRRLHPLLRQPGGHRLHGYHRCP